MAADVFPDDCLIAPLRPFAREGFRQSRRNIARRILCLRPKTPVAQGQAEAEDEESLLSEMMQSFAMVRDKWLSDITTLVMVMLYDTDFKYRFSRCLCKYYTGIIMEVITGPAAPLPARRPLGAGRETLHSRWLPGALLALVQEP